MPEKELLICSPQAKVQQEEWACAQEQVGRDWSADEVKNRSKFTDLL